ncbi:MAG: pyridoxal 5'-phosphate synthase glutaminase subunit PdxT [Candidatus Nanopelagicaceae bacterium]|nr:pyridoxal 5'-phosphate synthase glutaminase subunit PdxT [Actinomycetota bacterium]NCV43456.1 pyridoxal 5'-phosphate synthase glutaminase subunit PdxT [Actinomycetota bacterium]NCV83283.1 pyridoxal 5'-phosphate synthase glutaminase subunit PdxT [Actinomycetota bacterium]NCV95131.1 pyridoxal 5'-phosphate synthase glutaminase subunit PdxT [Actinomycetota bacterium]NCW46962.1 pyridoxal 5'-phosphate synthase glutaminase subunit PdxT [Actinomycetota bacterium]
MIVGVLALQGDVREHISALSDCGVGAIEVRTLSELESVQALVIPGGESTTISKLARAFGLFETLQERIRTGMPVYGSCAGLILLADRVLDAIVGQESFGGLNVTARRNAFGRQVDSFESDIEFKGITGPKFRAIFIRAPWIEDCGEGVEVLAQIDGHPVAVRSKNLLATSFHPELTSDNRIHRYFVETICSRALRVGV